MPKINRKIPKESLNSRLAWSAVVAVIIVLAIQTVRVQVFPDKRAVSQADRQYWAHISVSPSRGDVRDRNGIPLAISVPSTSFYVDPKFWDPSNADELVPYLGVEIASRAASATSGRFRWLCRKMPQSIAQDLKKREINGLYTVEESRRMYPHGELASHVIGFCDIDDNGLAGIEREWNSILYTPRQNRLFVRDAKGGFIDMIGSSAGTLRSGAGAIKLTLDSKIQQIVEWKLKQGAQETRSDWGVGVCVDPKTGEILAMASYPWTDLNDRDSFRDSETLRNNVIARVYEPGSTFKPVIMGIIMDAAKASKGETFHCSGKASVADGVIRDVSAHGTLSLEGLIVKSCNIGMAAIGQRVDAQKVWGMLRQFGFGSRSGIEISGEEEGLMRMPEEWLGTSRANIAIGQGLAVTPLQLVMAISAIANGGDLLKPYIISEVTNGAGDVLHKGSRRVRASVLSRQTCRFLRVAMFKTVEDGSGKGAKVNGIQLAGKTGTAQVASMGQYAKGQYVSSFIGMWPYHDPDYVMLIALGQPKGDRIYGGQIAAPVFKSIVEEMSQISVAKAEAK